MGKRLYVGNLPYSINDQQLREIFAQWGGTNASVPPGPDGRSKGFGFIEVDEDKAEAAITAMNGSLMNGRPLTVNEARPRAERSDYDRRSGGGGGGYGGGGGGYGGGGGGGGYGGGGGNSGGGGGGYGGDRGGSGGRRDAPPESTGSGGEWGEGRTRGGGRGGREDRSGGRGGRGGGAEDDW